MEKKQTKKYILLKKIDWKEIAKSLLMHPVVILSGIIFFTISLIPILGYYFAVNSNIECKEDTFSRYEKIEVKEE